MDDGNAIGLVQRIWCDRIKKLFPFKVSQKEESSTCKIRKLTCNWSYKLHPATCSLNKTLWPIKYSEFTFLPEFKVQHKKLENFYFQEFIAKGSFGKVFRVNDCHNNTYALKVLSKTKILAEDYQKQLKDEISIQTAISHHPSVVTILSQWQDKSNIYLLTEFICNGELFSKIKTFSIELVRIYITELAIILDFLHNAGIIYRDLKSENILLDADYHIKIADFGLSKWLKRGHKTYTICGTFNFMAPEIFDKNGYSHAVDYWSLGILAHLMLTGQYPQNNDNPQDDNDDFNGFDEIPEIGGNEKENTHKVTNPDPDSRKLKLSSDSMDLLNRLLEKNPQYRLKSYLALKKIAIFKNFNFENVEKRKISPKQFL